MNVRKLRGIADDLFEQSKYEEAYYIYDEIYSQMWNAMGAIVNGLNEFSHEYLGSSFQANYKLRSTFSSQIAETVFKRWFDMDIDQTLNEMTFITYGHVQCICYSPILNKTISSDLVYNEFLVLQTLVEVAEKDDWVFQILRISAPVVEDRHLKKIRPLMTESNIKTSLKDNAAKLKRTDWKDINVCILDYLFNMGDNSSDLYTSIHSIVGAHFRQKTHRKKRGDKKEEKKQEGFKYQSYERYEKYESYERFDSGHSFKKDNFDATRATEFEKAKYYGQVLGLSGKITKTHIRKKYLEMVAQYHPDKVFDLGEELKVLAEIKTKQINAAYDWMKKKYNI
jgi:hypothetical protein